LVGSNNFYKKNQIFFMLALFSKLLESVTYNSLSCLPGLFFVLILFAMYDLRKKYSRVYRVFSFLVVYWIQFMMILKLCVQIYIHIPSVNAELTDPKNESSLYLQMMFGRIHKLSKPGEAEEKNKADPNAALFQFLAFFISIYCT